MMSAYNSFKLVTKDKPVYLVFMQMNPSKMESLCICIEIICLSEFIVYHLAETILSTVQARSFLKIYFKSRNQSVQFFINQNQVTGLKQSVIHTGHIACW